jgi:hypothetical protein
MDAKFNLSKKKKVVTNPKMSFIESLYLPAIFNGMMITISHLFKRKAMWNKYLGQFGIKNKSIETNSDLGSATLSYIQFLKTNIKQLENKNDNAKILSGFLQLELKKIEYMFLGEKISFSSKNVHFKEID